MTADSLPLAAPRQTAPVAAPTPPWWAHAAALALITAVVGYLARGLWGWTYDDAYIIYRYARNFAAGLGLVYNPGEPYLGSSSAGYTLLLALLHWAAPALDFPVLGSAVSAVGFWAAGALLWSLGVRTRALPAGLLAALFTVANPVLVESWGGEMGLLLPLVFGAVLCYARGWGAATGALLGFATLTRQDSLVLVALLGAHYAWTRRRVPWRAIAAFALVTAPWVAYSWLFFGSPIPGTLEAKIAQGQAGWPFFLSGALDWIGKRLGDGPARPIALALLVAGAGALGWDLWRRRPVAPWLLIVGWAALFAAGYTALRVAFYSWYAVPLAVAGGILIAWGAAGVARLAGAAGARLFHGARRPAVGVATVVAGALLLWPLALLWSFNTNFVATHRESDLYARAGAWLAAHGGPAVSVAYLEVGEVGYTSGARVVDLLGLVTPGVAAHVPSLDYDWAVQRYAPDYYLANSRFDTLLWHLQQEAWFTAAYTPVATLVEQRRSDPRPYSMTIYARRPGAALPPPLRPALAQRITQVTTWIEPRAPFARRPGQTFTMHAPNLSAIALQIGKPYTMTTGSLVLRLRAAPTAADDLRAVTVPVGDLVNDAWYTFRFAPLADSAGRQYFFTLELSGVPAGSPPLAFWCATDDLLPGGARYLGATPQPGDLTLRVSVPDAPP